MAKILVNAGQEQVPANSHWLLLWPQLTTVHSINSSMFLSPWSTFLPSVAFSSPVPLLHLCFSIIFFNIFFLNFYIIQAFMNLILLLQDPDQLLTSFSSFQISDPQKSCHSKEPFAFLGYSISSTAIVLKIFQPLH